MLTGSRRVTVLDVNTWLFHLRRRWIKRAGLPQIKRKKVVSVPRYVRNEHSYTSANISRTDQPEHAEGDDNWKEGKRIVEFGVLLSNLRHCEACRHGPVALTYDSVVGELQKGLGGYLYVKCSNNDCNHVSRVPFGSTHRVKKLGMPCFAINTKLGTGK